MLKDFFFPPVHAFSYRMWVRLFDFAEVLSRAMCVDKTVRLLLYSSHDGGRDTDLRRFGRMECAGIWLWWF